MQANMRVTHGVVSEQKEELGDLVVLIEVKPREGKAYFTLQWQRHRERTIQWNWQSFISPRPNGPELAVAFRCGCLCLCDLPGVLEIYENDLEQVETKIADIK